MEASGHARWFERLLAELEFELWIGDAAEIRTKRVRKQKTDRQDAQLILRLLVEDRFPRIWVPSWENRDLRQLLWHRHRMVQARTRIMNQLQAVALNEGLRCKKRLWRDAGRAQLEAFDDALGMPAGKQKRLGIGMTTSLQTCIRRLVLLSGTATENPMQRYWASSSSLVHSLLLPPDSPGHLCLPPEC
jgi:transposase